VSADDTGFETKDRSLIHSESSGPLPLSILGDRPLGAVQRRAQGANLMLRCHEVRAGDDSALGAVRGDLRHSLA